MTNQTPYLYRKLLEKSCREKSRMKEGQLKEQFTHFRIEKKDVAKVLNDLERWDLIVKQHSKFPYFEVKERFLSKPFKKDIKLG